MKKILLIAAVLLLATTATAQLKRSADQPITNKVNLSYVTRELKMAKPGEAPARETRLTSGAKGAKLVPSYRRPAGAFHSLCSTTSNGYFSDFLPSIFVFKPFSKYTFQSMVEGADGNTCYAWDVFNEQGTNRINNVKDLTVEYRAVSTDGYQMPILYAVDGDLSDATSQWYNYQLTELSMVGTDTTRVDVKAQVYPYKSVFGDTVINLLSSKTMLYNGRFGDQDYAIGSYYGATPYGDNDLGWWFGKNASGIQGMGQAFEKPEHSYVLKKVYLLVGGDYQCNAPTSVNCKVYRLDEIPAFRDNEYVELPAEPGELIATGVGTFKTTLGDYYVNVVGFELTGVNTGDLVIDYPILVTIDGYNEPAAANLVDFHAYCAVDNFDEGFGELAYLKAPVYDEDGNPTDEYVWRGLNYFFHDVDMKTGLTIYIDADFPFIALANRHEDPEYTFSGNGGAMNKEVVSGDTATFTDCVEFASWPGMSSGKWQITYNGSTQLPNWLQLIFVEDDLTSTVGYYRERVKVIAQPLPTGLAYREATIRFCVQGEYVDYRFVQTTDGARANMLGDVDSDGSVGISDVTTLINHLLTGNTSGISLVNADVNRDGAIAIADVTTLMNFLLTGNGIEPIKKEVFTVNGVSFTMVEVEGGSFLMGATTEQAPYANGNEKPVHKVSISSFYMGQTEVTQALWLAVMGTNPSQFKGDLNRPVEYVSWNECQTFIGKLNELTGRQFRLPTEAEWEYAARGGTWTKKYVYAGSNNIADVAWYNGNSSTTVAVASKAPNELGLYDMSGNVYELCHDYLRFTGDVQIDPVGGSSNPAIRGGSIDYGASNARVSARWNDITTSHYKDQGLRLAL